MTRKPTGLKLAEKENNTEREREREQKYRILTNTMNN